MRRNEIGWGFDADDCLSLHVVFMEKAKKHEYTIFVQRSELKVEEQGRGAVWASKFGGQHNLGRFLGCGECMVILRGAANVTPVHNSNSVVFTNKNDMLLLFICNGKLINVRHGPQHQPLNLPYGYLLPTA
jgi:hypothetical protein